MNDYQAYLTYREREHRHHQQLIEILEQLREQIFQASDLLSATRQTYRRHHSYQNSYNSRMMRERLLIDRQHAAEDYLEWARQTGPILLALDHHLATPLPPNPYATADSPRQPPIETTAAESPQHPAPAKNYDQFLAIQRRATGTADPLESVINHLDAHLPHLRHLLRAHTPCTHRWF